ncbi:MAG: aldehyde dehydrogenase family protein [Actinomycetia bacterium]|nr:aldehyde dehydrogenase family protein [Actinomycetes bacterium]
MADNLPLVRPFTDGDWADGDAGEQVVADKFTDEPATRVSASGRAQVSEALAAAQRAFEDCRLPQSRRAAILARAGELVTERAAELRAAVAADTGFAAGDVAREVQRTAETLQMCAEEARRLAGEIVPLGGVTGQEHRFGYTRLDPLGVVCAITPFNSPMNTLVHKAGPALAAGNAVVVKPAGQTPRCADALVRVLVDAGLPPGLITTLYGGGATTGQYLLEDPRPAYYAFTGSTRVGRHIHATVGMRRTQLEMGSLSSTIICADADLARAAKAAVAAGVLRKSGQVCTSVQRLYVDARVLEDVRTLMKDALARVGTGDPADPATAVGPLISPGDAARVKSWIDDAVAGGAELVAGGERTRNVVEPTVLASAPADAAIMQDEVFGPVIVLRPFTELDDAITEANATPYGLAAGIFTSDIGTALDAADRLHAGSVHVNETSSSRVDVMPFAGMKASGFGGPEGPRYAIRDMSQERTITVSRP